MPSTRQAEPAENPRAAWAGSLTPIRPADFRFEEARHLLGRAGFGGTPDQVQALASLGPEGAVDRLLEVEKSPRGERAPFSGDLIRPLTAPERRDLLRARRAMDEETLAKYRAAQEERQRRDRVQIREVQRWWLTRMIESPRPLEEKMTLFWHGLFATSHRTIENSFHMSMQNELFRRHALGNYGELLGAIIRDPAMLAYLDNNDSRKSRPNENLARELMELFSLGVGNYTERDIREGARALTGYTFRGNEFHFDRANHDPNPKNLLGRRGIVNGEDFVGAILAQRACARYIAARLYDFFAADVPEGGPADRQTRAVLDELARTLRLSNYRVRPMLRRLFLSQHFYSPAIVGQHIKSPVELVVGAVRSLLAPTRDLSILLDALGLMGQNILFPPSVKGWPGGRSWINTSTIYVRQNVLAFLLTGKRPQGYDPSAKTDPYDPAPILAPLAHATPGADRDPGPVIDYLLRFTLGRSPDHARDTLTKFIHDAGGRLDRDAVVGLLLLITAMPEYQLC